MPILDAEQSQHPVNLLAELSLLESDRQWWAVYTKPRQEKAFARQLIKFDVPFYLPLIPKENLIRGRRVKSHIPLFGGYVFMYSTEDERVKSLTTNRISTMLEVKDPKQLRDDLLSVSRLIESKAALTVESRMQTGDPVRIKNGSMAGLEGVVVERRGKARLLVAVTMLQQGVSVEIDDFVLEPI